MSILDGLGAQGAAGGSNLVDAAIGFVNSQPGGLNGIVQKFNDAGAGSIVSSWIGKGSNLPIDPATLLMALGKPLLEPLAAKVGMPVEQLVSILAMVLPGVVDRATPDGTLPEDGKLKPDNVLSALGGLMGMFGGNK
ncbi:YidB family protein [Robbsia sp. KACC 23696]|uniref:YidB family protein n=1 Tax=Robbsia sp. KACC 23696 TaxID=3149231 RepID=UPI00325C1B34